MQEKLQRLVFGTQQQQISASVVFEPFTGLNPILYNPYTEVHTHTHTFFHKYLNTIIHTELKNVWRFCAQSKSLRVCVYVCVRVCMCSLYGELQCLNLKD